MGEISQNIQEKLVIVRGAGDLATGVIQKLWHVGFKILVLETECPLAIRRTVSVCDAIFQKEQRVEDLVAVRITSLKDCAKCWRKISRLFCRSNSKCYSTIETTDCYRCDFG